MHPTTRSALIATLLLAAVPATQAGLGDWLEKLKPLATGESESGSGESPDLQSLTQGDMVSALKQALEKGVGHATDQLGRPGGFLDDARVRIPMPQQMAWTEKTLRSFGQDQIADDFVTSMNRAAERAVPEVVAVFSEAIKAMTLEDARGILSGPDDAATQYFQQHASENLTQRMRPLVSEATDAVGVTAYYKTMMSKAGGFSSLLSQQTLDLDSYVTAKAMDGLFLMIAEQEKAIRENPVERSTDLLRKVFGAAGTPAP